MLIASDKVCDPGYKLSILQVASTEGKLSKKWRYWPNIGCFDFNFERTVFFELTNDATELSAIKGVELRKSKQAILMHDFCC